MGDFHYAGLRHINAVGSSLGSGQTLPTMVFVAFQPTFAIITAVLITSSTPDP